MGTSQEIKDFITGFTGGWKLATPTEAEIKAKKEADEQDAITKRGDAYASGIPGRSGVQPYTSNTGEGGAPAGALPARSRPASFVVADSDPTMQSYLHTTVGKESNFDANAKNPNSSATGLGQFTDATWLATMKAHPELGLTPDGRTDPAQSVKATKALAQDNGKQLSDAGFDPNPGNLYVAHFLGAGGAKRMLTGLNQNPNAPAHEYADPASVKANRTVFFNKDGSPKTAAEFYRERTSRYQKRADGSGDDLQVTQMAAEGGLIMPTMQMPEEATGSAIPGRDQVALSGISGRDGQIAPGSNGEPDDPQYHRVAGVHEALDAGMNGIAKAFGFHPDQAALPSAGNGYSTRVRAYHDNEGAATPDEIAQIDRTIDPSNRLSGDARAVARLKAGYDFYVQKGEPEKAEKYAKSILLYTRSAVQYYGAQAQQKLQAGDAAGAAKDIQAAHNQMPDGTTLYVDKVGPNGVVDYRVLDEDGDLTERGQANANQLMFLATGMRNGNEWLAGINQGRANGISAAQKAAQKRRESDEGAANAFYAGSDNDLVARMSPEARKGFDAASPALKRQMLADMANRENAARAQAKDDQRQAYYQRKDAAQERKAQDQQEYAGHAAAIENARDALAEQMAADPDDTEKVGAAQKALKDAIGAGRAWAAGDSGRGAFVPQLERLARSQRGAAGGARTAEERKSAALDQQYAKLERAANREADPAKQAQLRAALPHARADIEWQKRDTGYDKDSIGAEVDNAIPGVLGVKPDVELNDRQNTDAADYGSVMSGILRGSNGISAKRAGELAKLAVKTGKIELLDDGTYSINGYDPIYMPRNAVAALARIRQRNQPQKPVNTVPNPMDQREGSNIPTPDEADRAESRASAIAGRETARSAQHRRDKSAEYEHLREQMGAALYGRVQKQAGKTDDSVPLAYMRKVVREQLGKQARGAIAGRDVNLP